jgi:hypothetical protein
MIAAARLALLYFSMHRFQRWLLAIGAGLLMIGVALGTVRIAGAIAVWVLETAAVPMAALLFRELSLRQTTSLAPHVRPRLLASLILFAAVMALTSAVRAQVAYHDPLLFPDATVTATFATAVALRFSVVNLALLGLARWPVPFPSWWPMIVLFVGIRWAIEGTGLPWLLRARSDLLPLAVALNAGAWAAFASWYLTTPTFPARRAGAFRRTPGRPSEQRALTPARAIAVLLSDGVTVRWHQWVLSGGAVLAVALWVLGLLLPPPDIANLLLTMGGILAGQFGTAAAADAQRARMVWLAAGSREEIFRLCERRALARCGTWALGAGVLGVYGWVLGLVGPAGAAWGVAFSVSLAGASSYAGLLFVTGHLARFVLATAVFASWLAGLALVLSALRVANGQTSPWLALPVVALLTEAVVARTIARHRWHEIDWLRQRPIRWLMPRSRVPYGR